MARNEAMAEALAQNTALIKKQILKFEKIVAGLNKKLTMMENLSPEKRIPIQEEKDRYVLLIRRLIEGRKT